MICPFHLSLRSYPLELYSSSQWTCIALYTLLCSVLSHSHLFFACNPTVYEQRQSALHAWPLSDSVYSIYISLWLSVKGTTYQLCLTLYYFLRFIAQLTGVVISLSLLAISTTNQCDILLVSHTSHIWCLLSASCSDAHPVVLSTHFATR